MRAKKKHHAGGGANLAERRRRRTSVSTIGDSPFFVNAIQSPMFRSQAFLKQFSSTSQDERIDCFQRFLPTLPAGMSDDLYAGVEDRLASDPEVFEQTLAEMVDLLWMQYDDSVDPIATEEWRLLRELMDEYAVQLDMQLVEYVMERVVNHRALND